MRQYWINTIDEICEAIIWVAIILCLPFAFVLFPILALVSAALCGSVFVIWAFLYYCIYIPFRKLIR